HQDNEVREQREWAVSVQFGSRRSYRAAPRRRRSARVLSFGSGAPVAREPDYMSVRPALHDATAAASVYWVLVSRAQPARRVLMVTQRGRTTALDVGGKSTVVIGRSSSCDVFLDESSVSRRHAVLHVHPDRVEIEALGSQNGTLLLGATRHSDGTPTSRGNETRLAPNQISPLDEDTMILIGTALLTLQVSNGPRMMDTGVPGMLVADPAMHRVLELADRAAPTDLTVLLL